jgi:TRAP-type C4-dicarboxylate transport system permease small subunit
MNKTKLIIWLIILGFMGLVMYQNEGHFFSTEQSLRLHLGLTPEYRTPELPLWIYYLVFFVFGLLVAFIFALPEKMRKRRALKQLAATATDREAEANALKSELARLKGEPLPGEPPESSITSPIKTR